MLAIPFGLLKRTVKSMPTTYQSSSTRKILYLEGSKTNFAKIIAKDTFVDEQPIIRIDRALVHESTELVKLASNHIASLLLSEERN